MGSKREFYIVDRQILPTSIQKVIEVNDLIQKENIRMKFNKGWKHGLISGKEIFWVGIVNGDPILKVINPF